MKIGSSTLAACVAGCLVALISGEALGWGGGHRSVMDAIVRRLPQELRSRLSPEQIKSTRYLCNYPDSMHPFKPDRVGPRAMELFKANRITILHNLHGDHGRAIIFKLLVEAMRDENYDRVMLWIAALGHTTADMVACNHDPLVHLFSNFVPPWGDMKLPGGAEAKLEVLLGRTDRDERLVAIFRQQIDATLIADDGRDAPKALADIMMYGYEGAEFCGLRGGQILADAFSWAANEDTAAHRRLWRTLSELGAWAVVRTLRDVNVAMRLAESGQPVELTDAVENSYGKRADEFVRARRLADDAIFASVLRELPAGSKPAIGVVLEPTWAMNAAMLGFAGRPVAAMVCRSLAEAGCEYATLDVRDILADGLPSPKRVPVVIVPAARFESHRWMKAADLAQRLEAYLAGGGKILWIAGRTKLPTGALGAMGKALVSGQDKRWPVPLEQFKAGRLVLIDGDTKQSWPFVRSPYPQYGWMLPYNPYHFDPQHSAEVAPLLVFAGHGASMVVGATSPAERPRVAYVPTYALLPAHLFTKGDIIENPSVPKLDDVGRKVLFTALRRLTGE